MNETISTFIKSVKNKHQKLYKLYTSFHRLQKPSEQTVLILNNPCYNFGDIVFAVKLHNILKEWYGCKIYIATPQPENFQKLGFSENLISLTSTEKAHPLCRSLQMLTPLQPLPICDIILVAPVVTDYDPKMTHVQKLIPYATKFNTYFITEYNDNLKKDWIDIQTGVGKGRYGLLITEPEIEPVRKTTQPFAVIYVNNQIDRVKSCILGFFSLVLKKHHNTDFEVIAPAWILDGDIVEDIQKSMAKIAKKYFAKMIVVQKESTEEINFKKRGYTLRLRLDVFPVPNKDMLSLLYHSVSDILLTGDQSITDVLSCCPNKNIYYQIAPWKENFSKQLEKELPNHWLHKKSESCGSLKSIRYKNRKGYGSFVKKWDFRTLAKPIMDSIFAFTEVSHDPIIEKYEKAVIHSRTMKGFFKRYGL